MNSSSSPGIEFQRKRKNLNWVQLQAPTSLGSPIRALLGDVRWLLTTNGLCLRADDANQGPVYYVHPSADVDLGWMVKHRLRTRSQRAHSVTFARNELEITQILNQASGVDELWLKRLSRIVRWTSPETIDGSEDPKAKTVAQLRAFQFRGDVPPRPFEPCEDLDEEAAERLEVQVQMSQGNLLPAFAWYERHQAIESDIVDPLSVLVAGLYGDVEGVRSAAERLVQYHGSSQPLHHFAYLAYKGAGCLEDASRHGTLAAEHASAMGAAGIYMDLARYQQRRHDNSGAWKSLLRGLEARPGTAWVNESAASIFEWMGALDEAEKLYGRAFSLDRQRFGPGAALARIRTWRGIYDPVRADVEALLSENPDVGLLHRLLGIIHVCEGRLEAGLASLNRALEFDSRDAEALFWRADVHLQKGHFDAATEDIERASVKSSSPVEGILRILRDMAIGHFDLSSVSNAQSDAMRHKNHAGEGESVSLLSAAASTDEFAHSSVRTAFNGALSDLGTSYFNPVKAFVHRHLPHLLSDEEWTEFWQGEDRAKQVLRNTLQQFGGNRTDIVTMRQPDPQIGQPDRLKWIKLPTDSRQASASALKQLRYESPEAVLARYADVFKAFPESPHPHCYSGELFVWLGRYEEALASFQAGKDNGPVRWGFVGKAAVLMLLGRKKEAMAEIERCGELFEPLPGATTHVYLGELLRREGDLVGARRHLTEAVEVKPTRYAAAMNLALVELMDGDQSGAHLRYRGLWDKVPGIFWTAGYQLSIPIGDRCDPRHMEAVIEESLRMMRGNRSSHLITYFPNDGRMRIAPQPDEWEDIAWESLPLREEILLRD